MVALWAREASAAEPAPWSDTHVKVAASHWVHSVQSPCTNGSQSKCRGWLMGCRTGALRPVRREGMGAKMSPAERTRRGGRWTARDRENRASDVAVEDARRQWDGVRRPTRGRKAGVGSPVPKFGLMALGGVSWRCASRMCVAALPLLRRVAMGGGGGGGVGLWMTAECLSHCYSAASTPQPALTGVMPVVLRTCSSGGAFHHRSLSDAYQWRLVLMGVQVEWGGVPCLAVPLHCRACPVAPLKRSSRQ